MELKTKTGRLTRYGLSCGYVERTETDYHFVTLFMDGSVILIGVFDRVSAERFQFNAKTIQEARKLYRKYSLSAKLHERLQNRSTKENWKLRGLENEN